MSATDAFYRNETAMEPIMPTDPSGQLREAAARLLSESAKLAGMLHPLTRARVARLVCHMNSFYSNLIEGHHTHPADIERALKNDYSAEPEKRALQLESAAHVAVEQCMQERLENPDEDICTDRFIRWLHKEFFDRMPPEFRIVSASDTPIEPGEYRTTEVQIGRHLAPAAASVPRFMARYAAYEPRKHDPLDRIIAAGAAHHRLVWIHPFRDGNGRVARLFTQAYFAKAGLETGGLWTVSRGLARQRDAYKDKLAAADGQRRNDLDGRGNLSNEALVAFCTFFIGTARDQVRFMSELLELDSMQDRILRFAQRWNTLHDSPPKLGELMREAFLRGSVSRGDAAAILGMQERTARRQLASIIDQGLMSSEGPGAPVSIGLSTATIGYLFPRLYPEGVEIEQGPSPSEIERARARVAESFRIDTGESALNHPVNPPTGGDSSSPAAGRAP